MLSLQCGQWRPPPSSLWLETATSRIQDPYYSFWDKSHFVCIFIYWNMVIILNQMSISIWIFQKKICLQRFWYHPHIPSVGKPQAAKKKDHILYTVNIVYNNNYRYNNTHSLHSSRSTRPMEGFLFVQEQKTCMKIRTTSVPCRSTSNRLFSNLSFSREIKKKHNNVRLNPERLYHGTNCV